MGQLFLKSIRDLSDALILSPERYDPRRSVQVHASVTVGGVADLVVENILPKDLPPAEEVLVLDTTHAYDGFVLFKHGLVPGADVGSAKRHLRPGDIIISRLRSYLRQVAFVDEKLFRLVGAQNQVVASTEFFVLRGRPGFDVAALVPYLLSEQVQAALAAAQEGGHHPRFNRDVLDSLPVPEWMIRENLRIGREVRRVADAMRGAVGAAAAAVREVERECNSAQKS